MSSKIERLRDMFPDAEMFKLYYRGVTGDEKPTRSGDARLSMVLGKHGLIPGISKYDIGSYRKEIRYVHHTRLRRRPSTMQTSIEAQVTTPNFTELADMLDEVSAKLREMEG